MSTSPAGTGGRPPTRSRIVIDVNKARAAEHKAGRGGGARKRTLTLVGIAAGVGLLVAALVGYAMWQRFKQSPSYSLALIADAARRDDVRAVNELVDPERVAQSLVPQVAEKLSGRAQGQAAQGQAAPALPPQVVGLLSQQLLPHVREAMRDEVFRQIRATTAESGGDLPFFARALAISAAADVAREGDAATVRLTPEERPPVELQMQRAGERWKIVSLKNEEVAANIAGRIAGGLPPAGAAPQPAEPPRRPVRRR